MLSEKSFHNFSHFFHTLGVRFGYFLVFFSVRGRGKEGSVRAGGGGGGGIFFFFTENIGEGGGLSEEEGGGTGAARISARRRGWGVKYFFSGPKCPPSTFPHFFRIFPPGVSPSKQRALARWEQQRRKDNKKNWTNRCCTLVVARLSSSYIFLSSAFRRGNLGGILRDKLGKDNCKESQIAARQLGSQLLLRGILMSRRALWKRGIRDVLGILPGCPGSLGVFKKFVQKSSRAFFVPYEMPTKVGGGCRKKKKKKRKLQQVWPIGCDTPSPFSERFPLEGHAKWRCDNYPPPPQKSGTRLRGRTATQRSKKGSEKVLDRVLRRGFSEGFWEGGFPVDFNSKKGSEKGSLKGFWEGGFQKVPRTPPQRVRGMRRKKGYLSDTCAIPCENKAKCVRDPRLRYDLGRVLRDMGGSLALGR